LKGKWAARRLAGKDVRETLDMQKLDWPGGRGHEIGTVLASLSKIEKTIELSRATKPIKILTVTEGGIHAVMLVGLVKGPISFLSEPEMSKDKLAVIAGVALDAEEVWAALIPYLGRLTFSRSHT
jgi:hypothetical protein